MTVAEYMISSRPVISKSTPMIPINFLKIKIKIEIEIINLESRMLDNIAYIDDKSNFRLYLLQSVFSLFIQVGTIIDSFQSAANSSLCQVELISFLIS